MNRRWGSLTVFPVVERQLHLPGVDSSQVRVMSTRYKYVTLELPQKLRHTVAGCETHPQGHGSHGGAPLRITAQQPKLRKKVGGQ